MRSPAGTRFCYSSSCPCRSYQIPVLISREGEFKEGIWLTKLAVSFRIGCLYTFQCFVEHLCLFKYIDVDNSKYLNYFND
ncbi:hypothetical protein ACRRTK_008612 [Alexandromys fortis]